MAKRILPYLSIIFLLSLFSCQENKEQAISLKSETIINTVPSASGLICKGDHIWLVGDDASNIFELNSKNEIINQYQISAMNRMKDGRILKAIKPDFESIDEFDGKLIIMGSGSKEISRDTAVIFSLNERKVFAKKTFRPLFQEFLKMGGFDSTQSINMEGLASDKENFYLLHRGNICGKNMIFQVSKEQMFQFIESDSLAKFTIYAFDLPKIDGFQSGFSGACISPDQNYLIYTASVESTSDVYHDGEVLGSFIGAIPIHGENAWKANAFYPLTKNDTILKTKLESICVKSVIKNLFNVICVSDNDNGESGIYKIQLNWEQFTNQH